MKVLKNTFIILFTVSAACLFVACANADNASNGGSFNSAATVYETTASTTSDNFFEPNGQSATEDQSAESMVSPDSADDSEERLSIPDTSASALPIAQTSDEPAPKSPETSPFDYETTDGKVLITGLYGDLSENITIPAALSGLDVYGVKAKAFADNASVETVVIESGVEVIGDGCFANCTNLKKLVIPQSVINMGYGVLSGCSSLEELTLPFTGKEPRAENKLNDYPFGYIFGETKYKGGTVVTQYMHTDSFDYVESADYVIPSTLKTVTVTGSESATFLPYAAFYNCDLLDNVVIGGLFTKIGRFVFSGCTAKITFDSPTIKCLGEDAIADYKGTSFTIPASVEIIGIRALSDCPGLVDITVPDSVKYIDLFAFSYCYELKTVTLGDGVEFLGMCAFYFCPNLKTVNLGKKLREIDERAFSSCKSLTSINFPAALEKIGYYVFDGCANLKTIAFADADDWYIYNPTTSGFFVESAALTTPEKTKQTLTKTYPDYIWRKRRDG